MRCLLFSLNQESWLVRSTLVLKLLVLPEVLPPNATVFETSEPSGKSELMSTAPLGSATNGVM
jgi:hypothetical protein